MEAASPNYTFQTRHFLVVEDDPNDAIQIRRIFNSLEPKCTLFVCRNTSEARAYLKGAGMYVDRITYPIPDTVISDIRLPEESGIDLIRWLRSEEQFAGMPIVVLTGAATQEEIQATKELGVDLILRKPAKPANFKALLQGVAENFCKDSSPEPVGEALLSYVLDRR
jgi:CheY-like chemotaxis protein